MIQDLQHAMRALLKHPGYFATALLTLALGIGFSTATFSVIYAVLLRPLPYKDPDRLVVFAETHPPRFPRFAVSPGHYLFWRDHATAFEGISAWAVQSVNLETATDDPQRIRADRVSANLFSILGVQPIAGRDFEAADEQADRAMVALLSYGAWRRRFGGDPTVIGRTVRMDRNPVTIVGIMPEHVRIPSRETEMWVPLVLTPQERRAFGSHFMQAVARLRPGITREAAAADMQAVSQRLWEFNKGSAGWNVLILGMHGEAVEDVRLSLLVLFGAVGLVLLIACANVANLMLARGAARQRELAIRASIGATRIRLLRQLLVEQLALAAGSTVAGVLLAAWLLRVVIAMVPDALPAHANVTLDRTVLGFALLLAVLTPLFFGLLPAVHASRADLRTLTAPGGRQGAAAPARRTRTALVVAEIALAMTLLVGAWLLIRSFDNLVGEPPGFNPERAILAGVSLPEEKYPQGEPRERFFAEFLDRVHGLPDVEAAGLSMPMPLVDAFNSGLEFEGIPTTPDDRPLTMFYAVSPGFFEAMQIPLLAGRYITAEDRRGGTRVAVVSKALADQHFAGVDPLGKRIRVSQGERRLARDRWRGRQRQAARTGGQAAEPGVRALSPAPVLLRILAGGPNEIQPADRRRAGAAGDPAQHGPRAAAGARAHTRRAGRGRGSTATLLDGADRSVWRCGAAPRRSRRLRRHRVHRRLTSAGVRHPHRARRTSERHPPARAARRRGDVPGGHGHRTRRRVAAAGRASESAVQRVGHGCVHLSARRRRSHRDRAHRERCARVESDARRSC